MNLLLTEEVFHGLILLALGAGLAMIYRLLRAWEQLSETLKACWIESAFGSGPRSVPGGLNDAHR